MTDVVSAQVRSRMMAGIRSKNTKPELIVRRGLHRRGFRFRLHEKALPGRPDLVLPKYRTAVFVHGCFWHGHECELFKWPKTREAFWRTKIDANRRRDTISMSQIEALGWRAEIIWECQVRGAIDEVNLVLDGLASTLRSHR